MTTRTFKTGYKDSTASAYNPKTDAKTTNVLMIIFVPEKVLNKEIRGMTEQELEKGLEEPKSDLVEYMLDDEIVTKFNIPLQPKTQEVTVVVTVKPLDLMFDVLHDRENVQIISVDGQKMIFFCLHKSEVEDVGHQLEHLGVGIDFGYFLTVPLAVPKLVASAVAAAAAVASGAAVDSDEEELLPNAPNATGVPPPIGPDLPPVNTRQQAMDNFRKTLKARIAVESVLEKVHEMALFSFDYAMLLAVAATIALLGLITDNPVVVVASMLVSPLMGPILGITFGSTVKDMPLIKTGAFSEAVGLLLCFLVGFFGGLLAAPAAMRQRPWPTNEMSQRADGAALYVGLAIALPSGLGVALSVLGENTSSLVGVAISAALLPPAVNSGLYLAAACFADAYNCDDIDVPYCEDALSSKEYALGAFVSLALTILNIVCIILSAAFMFRVKETAPIKRKTDFWSKLVPEARAFNATLKDPRNPLKEEFAREMKRQKQKALEALAGADPLKTLMATTMPSNRVSELEGRADAFAEDFFDKPLEQNQSPRRKSSFESGMQRKNSHLNGAETA